MPWADVSGGLGDRHHTWARRKAGARGTPCVGTLSRNSAALYSKVCNHRQDQRHANGPLLSLRLPAAAGPRSAAEPACAPPRLHQPWWAPRLSSCTCWAYFSSTRVCMSGSTLSKASITPVWPAAVKAAGQGEVQTHVCGPLRRGAQSPPLFRWESLQAAPALFLLVSHLWGALRWAPLAPPRQHPCSAPAAGAGASASYGLWGGRGALRGRLTVAPAPAPQPPPVPCRPGRATHLAGRRGSWPAPPGSRATPSAAAWRPRQAAVARRFVLWGADLRQTRPVRVRATAQHAETLKGKMPAA